jgi:hypothetical protein
MVHASPESLPKPGGARPARTAASSTVTSSTVTSSTVASGAVASRAATATATAGAGRTAPGRGRSPGNLVCHPQPSRGPPGTGLRRRHVVRGGATHRGTPTRPRGTAAASGGTASRLRATASRLRFAAPRLRAAAPQPRAAASQLPAVGLRACKARTGEPGGAGHGDWRVAVGGRASGVQDAAQ